MLEILRFISTHPLTKNAKLAAYVRVVRWQLRSRLGGEVIMPWIEGAKLAVRRGMTGATGNIYAGLHEFADMGFLLHLLRAGDVFIDAGANVGSYTVLASGVCGAHTIAFEPDPQTATHLRRNLDVNGIEALVTIHERALGPEAGEVHFTIGRDTVNQVVLAKGADTRKVTQVRLDQALKDQNPILMKMDLEGYEDAALRGAEDVLAKQSLKAIEVETVSEEASAILSRHGFERMYYDPFTRKLSREPQQIKASNALYIRDAEFVAARLGEAKAAHVLGTEI